MLVMGWLPMGSHGCPPRCPQDRLALTPTFKQRKALLAQEGCDPSRVAAPLLLLDLPAAAYVPMGPAQWHGVVTGRVRL